MNVLTQKCRDMTRMRLGVLSLILCTLAGTSTPQTTTPVRLADVSALCRARAAAVKSIEYECEGVNHSFGAPSIGPRNRPFSTIPRIVHGTVARKANLYRVHGRSVETTSTEGPPKAVPYDREVAFDGVDTRSIDLNSQPGRRHPGDAGIFALAQYVPLERLDRGPFGFTTTPLLMAEFLEQFGGIAGSDLRIQQSSETLTVSVPNEWEIAFNSAKGMVPDHWIMMADGRVTSRMIASDLQQIDQVWVPTKVVFQVYDRDRDGPEREIQRTEYRISNIRVNSPDLKDSYFALKLPPDSRGR